MTNLVNPVDDKPGVIACLRCKTRKIKCDRQMPKCTNCEKSGHPCMTIDPATGRQVPRSYLNHLETRVKQLESELETARQITATSIPAYAWLPETELPYHGEASGFTFANRLAQELNERNIHGVKFDNFSSLASPGDPPVVLPKDPWCLPVNLPSKRNAESLIKWYFEQINCAMPVFHRDQFIRQYFEPVYGPISPDLEICSDYTKLDLRRSSQEPGTGTFYRRWVDCGNSLAAAPEPRVQRCLYFLYIIFALATVSDNQIASQEPERGPRYLSASMSYYTVTASGKSRDDQIRSLQAILLLSIYGTIMPMNSSAWFTTGNAIRMCIHMGLHNDSNTECLDEFSVDMRRRLFWTSYYLDRSVSFSLGRPCSIEDYHCTCPLPSLADDSWIKPTGVSQSQTQTRPAPPDRPSYKWIFRSMLDLRKIQQRVDRELYSSASTSGASPITIEANRVKRQSILRELDAWHKALPRAPELLNYNWNCCMFDVSYEFTKMIMFRDSPGIPEPTIDEYRIAVDAAFNMLNIYYGFYDQRYFVYTWTCIHNMMQGCAAVLYALYHTNCFDHTFDLDSFEELVMVKLCRITRQLKLACPTVITACESMKQIIVHSLKYFRAHKGENFLPNEIENKGSQCSAKRRKLPDTILSMTQLTTKTGEILAEEPAGNFTSPYSRCESHGSISELLTASTTIISGDLWSGGESQPSPDGADHSESLS